MRFHVATSLLIALLSLSNAQTTTWLSRPKATTIVLKVLKNSNPSVLAPGYLFTTPWGQPLPANAWGPHIFDHAGNLIWAGNDTVEIRAMDTHVCSYRGQLNSICYNDANPVDQGGHSSGFIRFLDNSYTQLGPTRGGVNGLRGPDIHELNTPNNTVETSGDRFLQDVYQLADMDLREWTGPEQGLVLNGCFQDVDIPSGDLNFQWCSLDHVPVFETYEWLASSDNHSRNDFGDSRRPWDYFHINAMDRDEKGDYYVSARNTCTIYKIAGPDHPNPGEVIWRLGGRYGDFEMLEGLNFSFQHHIRVEELTSSMTRVSLFDNATPEIKRTARASTGKIIELDTVKMTAKLVEEYIQPSGLICGTEGSVQRLQNDNVFVGWGSEPYISEHVKGHPGEAIFYAVMAPGKGRLQGYRSYKFEWKGEPKSPPDVFAYSKTNQADAVLAVYMSWNGATEYKAWRVFVAKNRHDDGIAVGAVYPRIGYETAITLRPGYFSPFVYVQAIGEDGSVLKTSARHKVFVPKSHSLDRCGISRCEPGFDYGFEIESSAASDAIPAAATPITVSLSRV